MKTPERLSKDFSNFKGMAKDVISKPVVRVGLAVTLAAGAGLAGYEIGQNNNHTETSGLVATPRTESKLDLVALFGKDFAKAAEAWGVTVPFEKGKYQTFPRSVITENGVRKPVYHEIDLGTLGPDVDTIFGIDFSGDIPTGALVIHQPAGEVKETRVVAIKRTDVETVQFTDALGGDRFDMQKISDFGGDPALDAMARLHAQNTARQHQKVVYIGDLGLFIKQFGPQEQPLLNAIIRAMRPGRPDIGIQEPNFVNPRQF